MNLKKMSLIDLLEKVNSKELTREEVFDYFLKRIEKYDDKLNCFNLVNKN
ncbi:MAG: hypothetical protein P1U46_01260 [Patescibacteria group bacterium]|nr:hypothetical protein [Patescibacteria group bacterium]